MGTLEQTLDQIYEKCIKSLSFPLDKVENHVKIFYEPFTDNQISTMIASMLKGEKIKSDVEIIFKQLRAYTRLAQII